MMFERPRRNRQSSAVRDLVQETQLRASDFVYPVFIQEGTSTQTPITSMPGVFRYTLDLLPDLADTLIEKGIKGAALFPLVPDAKKNALALEAVNADNLICQAAKQLKTTHPNLMLFGDVALDPYSSDGHDGLVENCKILNDETLEVLAQMAVIQAESGIDCVAPSDMMDGRVGYIRSSLDDIGFSDTIICSYTAKYASSFYGPFRDALESAPKAGDKKTYQMNPANRREAMREARLDSEEGADMLMVKPAGTYLDIISDLKQQTDLPIVAYQVSGEYSMLIAGADKGCFNYEDAMLESLIAIKRAGADIIFSYGILDIVDRL